MKEDTEQVKRELERIAKTNKGCITPQEVVASASNPESVLHDYFEWNDGEAAQHFRIIQARELIRSVKVVVTVEKIDVKTVGFVRNPTLEHGEAGYISVKTIRHDEDVKRDVLLAEFARAEAAIRRAGSLAAVFGLTSEVDDFLKRLGAMRDKVAVAKPRPRPAAPAGQYVTV